MHVQFTFTHVIARGGVGSRRFRQYGGMPVAGPASLRLRHTVPATAFAAARLGGLDRHDVQIRVVTVQATMARVTQWHDIAVITLVA